MVNVGFFPVYGLLFGVNYASQSADEDFDMEDNMRMVQVCFGLFGISFIWFANESE